MLSYRHAFHAGNFADVHKHLVLILLIESLKRKDKAFCYIDTHAGCGLYKLNDTMAMKNQEFIDGIFRLLSRSDTPDPLVDEYLKIIKKINTSSTIKIYPGSPMIAASSLRPHDRLILTELHSNEYPLLKNNLKNDNRTAVHNQNGYQSLKAFIPPKERRGLVLIDPSYELSDEYERVAKEVIKAYQKWRRELRGQAQPGARSGQASL